MVSLKHEVISLVEKGIGTTNKWGTIMLAKDTNALLARIVVAEFLHEHGYHKAALDYLLEGSGKSTVYLLLCREYNIYGGLPPVVDEVFNELRKEFE